MEECEKCRDGKSLPPQSLDEITPPIVTTLLQDATGTGALFGEFFAHVTNCSPAQRQVLTKVNNVAKKGLVIVNNTEELISTNGGVEPIGFLHPYFLLRLRSCLPTSGIRDALGKALKSQSEVRGDLLSKG